MAAKPKGQHLDTPPFDRAVPGVVLKQGSLADYVGPRVRLTWNLLNARMVAIFTPFGLRPGAFSAMALISANAGCSQNDLAAGLGMDKSALVAVIDELERRGFAQRVRSGTDRRRYAMELTATGEETLAGMKQAMADAGVPIRGVLSAEEFRTLLSLLDRVNEALATS